MAKAAVVGLGTMGPGIAQTLARAGMEVTAFDVSEDQRKKAPEGIELANKVLTALGLPDRAKAPVKIAGNRTSKETVKWMVSTIKDLGLLPVVVQKDVPGFVENRVLYALLRECVDLVDQGVIDAEGLDTCVSWGIGYKLSVIGPMALLDMAGLDIYQAVGSYLNKDLCNRGDLSPYVTERTKAGKLGMKTGGGIFNYTPEKIAELRGLRAKRLVAVRKALES